MADERPPAERQLVLTVAEVAEWLGVPTRTVRHWSDIGYLPARRTPGGQRRYSPGRGRGIRPGASAQQPEQTARLPWRHSVGG